jgi:uncharacterized membrane protein
MIPTSHFHPMLVHFPIALVTIGFGVELASIFIKKEVCLPKVSYSHGYPDRCLPERCQVAPER